MYTRTSLIKQERLYSSTVRVGPLTKSPFLSIVAE